MNQIINSHILKLSGRAELPKEISIGHNYEINAKGSITKEELHDNENGTFNKVYTFKPITTEIITGLGETLKLKDTRRTSQLIRSSLWKLHDQEGYVEPFDEVYEQVGFLIMRDLPQYLREAVKRLEK
jgi:hypothetical protein